MEMPKLQGQVHTTLNGSNNLLIAALEYANRGWRVFPCKPKTKEPLTKNGFKDATTDKKIITEWWTKHPNANIGSADPLVYDADTKEVYERTLKLVEGSHIPVAKSVRGGHFYFAQTTPPVGCFKVEGGEIRGDGWYVILPPSIHPDGPEYTWVVSPNGVLPEPPEWLLTMERKERATSNNSDHSDFSELYDLAHSQHLDNAALVKCLSIIRSLRETDAKLHRLWAGTTSGYPSASEADLALVGKLKGIIEHSGITDARQQALLAHELFTSSPHYTKRQEKWESQRGDITYGWLTVLKTTSAELRQLNGVAPRPENTERRTWLTEPELNDLPKPEFLIANEIVKSEINLVYGPSGAGKTFQVLDYCRSVLATSGSILWVAAEDARGLKVRLQALRAFHNVQSGTFDTWPEELDLMHHHSVDDFITQRRGSQQDLVVIDTLALCISAGGGDENSAKDMGIAINSLKHIANELNTTVIAIHHTGKNEETERGSYALRGAAYMIIRVSQDSEGIISIKCEKAKNSEEFETRRSVLEKVGESAVIAPVAPKDDFHIELGLTAEEKAILSRLYESGDKGLGTTQLQKKLGLRPNDFNRVSKNLVKSGYIYKPGNNKSPWLLTEEGEKHVQEQ